MATKINIKNIPVGYQSMISNGKHIIVGDEPISSNGTDLGFSPSDLLLSALGMCKVATIRHIARKRSWNLRDVDAELTLEVKRGEARKLSSVVTVAIKIESEITDEQKAELLNEADKCYIHRMIEGQWNIDKSVELK